MKRLTCSECGEDLAYQEGDPCDRCTEAAEDDGGDWDKEPL